MLALRVRFSGLEQYSDTSLDPAETVRQKLVSRQQPRMLDDRAVLDQPTHSQGVDGQATMLGELSQPPAALPPPVASAAAAGGRIN